MLSSLRDEHLYLFNRIEEVELQDEYLFEVIRSFIDRCREAGKHTSNIEDRAELRDIFSHWNRFAFEKTLDPSYLSAQIEESDLGLTYLRLTFDELTARCQGQADQFISGRVREGVFKSERAVPRQQMEEQIRAFLHGDWTGLVLTGAVGVGKTFLACQLASERPWETNDELVLISPYECQELSVAISLSELDLRIAIEQQIVKSLGVDSVPSLHSNLNFIDGLLEQNNAYLLIWFDGVERFKVNQIDESSGELKVIPRVREFLLSFNAIVKTYAARGTKRIKFLLSCVDSTWVSLQPERLLTWHLFFTPDAETKSLVMEKFTSDEFENAIDTYAFHPGIPNEEIERLSERNPYLLRLTSELASELEAKETEDERKDLVAREFYSERILRGRPQEQRQKQHFLLKFAERLEKYTKNGQEMLGVPSDDPIFVSFSNAYELLELDGITSQERIRDPFPRILIRLNPPDLAKFIQGWYGAKQES